MSNLVYLYLLAPLHTGGTTQEGNLLGIARESHTDLPYIPSSTIRGRQRASVSDRLIRTQLFGPELKDLEDRDFVEQYQSETGHQLTQLEQGNIWIGDGSILWLPVPSLSHGVIWITCPMLLHRWKRFNPGLPEIPPKYSTNLNSNRSAIYLKDAIFKNQQLQNWNEWRAFIPHHETTQVIERVLVLSDRDCAILIQMSLWRQVKIKLDEHKTVDGGFRYEEAIPPETIIYFPWGLTSAANGQSAEAEDKFKEHLEKHEIIQIGGQESLGRGFVQQWSGTTANQS
ncbi:type III-B CRISPR module RAMP protein Cmr4 [Oxynema sp. CENA135]|uniref:type III-B CRISPR module RAMP protein Cmr4 n=1 Tax=Oxynema sp. CENA135 TaxID=984206 RepID=UPI00190E462C|nr:type III-B CRISPR module RAMP protein Cmr4 [Oxynema sp. CENA135]MBK4728551.1 type III-B CRISPR module RAMP protein Cmr4 [Oxynema sp. CENA135]